jgi:hypothetical protein
MSRKYQKDYAESVGKHHDFADDKEVDGSLKQIKRYTEPLLIRVFGFGWLAEFFELLGILDRTEDN